MGSPQFQRIKLSRSGTTAVLALASDKVNALDLEVLRELSTCVDHCEEDPAVDVLVVTGEGSVFSAGLNVSQVLGNDTSYTDALLDALTRAFVRLFRCSKPTVAAINGAAIAGGCLLALTCDKRLIAEEARIGVTELRVGVAFPIVAVELLRHACGPRAERLMLDATLLDAEGACQAGLAHLKMPRSELNDAAMAAAAELASFDARAYALAKAASRRVALSAMEDAGSRAIEPQVRAHWRDGATRDNLEQLLKPKG